MSALERFIGTIPTWRRRPMGKGGVRAFHGDACTGGVRPKPCGVAPRADRGDWGTSNVEDGRRGRFGVFLRRSHPESAQVRCLGFWGKVQSRSRSIVRCRHSETPSHTSGKAPRRLTTKAGCEATTKAGCEPQRFLRFYHSEDLRIKTLALLTALEQAPDPTKHRVALAELIVELSGVGMDCYFMQPIKLAKPGFIVEQTASWHIRGHESHRVCHSKYHWAHEQGSASFDLWVNS